MTICNGIGDLAATKFPMAIQGTADLAVSLKRIEVNIASGIRLP